MQHLIAMPNYFALKQNMGVAYQQFLPFCSEPQCPSLPLHSCISLDKKKKKTCFQY